jgi:hypothetical protein
MSTNRPVLCLILGGLLLVCACKKSNHSGNNTPKTPSVYVLGTTGDSIVYWKDDTVHLITTTVPGTNPEYTITSMAIANGHAYACGTGTTWNGNIMSTAAYLWTDGNRATLPYTGNATAKVVFTSGTDVYVAGTGVVTQGTAAILWKNGTASTLTDTGTIQDYVSGGLASGSNIYVSGGNSEEYELNPSQTRIAAYWKNGGINSLDGGLVSTYPGGNLIQISPFTTGIYVSGNDVYVSGALYNEAAMTPIGQGAISALYWKNGVLNRLDSTADGTRANAIFATNDTVYVVGTINYIGADQACIWENGVLVKPGALSLTNSGANAVTVVNSDVYVAGYDYVNSQSVATFWKNGTVTHLGTGGVASAIVVQ